MQISLQRLCPSERVQRQCMRCAYLPLAVQSLHHTLSCSIRHLGLHQCRGQVEGHTVALISKICCKIPIWRGSEQHKQHCSCYRGCLLITKCDANCSVQSEREVLDAMNYQWPDLQWALSVLHSRCFTMGSPALHLTAPGIDMANHTFTPNATVRWDP